MRPRLAAWTARVWRESVERAIPLVKIESRLDIRDVENRELAEALRPFAGVLQKLVLYVVHADTVAPVTAWSVGRLEVHGDRAYMFFRDFLAASNGALLLNLLQTAGAQSEILISVVPMSLAPDRLTFAVTDYDFGIHNRIG